MSLNLIDQTGEGEKEREEEREGSNWGRREGDTEYFDFQQIHPCMCEEVKWLLKWVLGLFWY